MTITYRQRKILTYVALHRRYWHSLYRVWGKDVVELQNKGLLTKTGGSVTLSKKGLDAIVTARIICEDKP